MKKINGRMKLDEQTFELACEELGMEARDQILVALSGGLDSVTLAHLLHASGYKIALAHVNFGLRGADSDADEQFCRTLAEKLDATFYTIRQTNWGMGGSIQMQARKFRYRWFQKLASRHQYRWILTAHHLDDRLETLLINILRGTGLRGLQGMPEKRGKILRPLMRFGRESILEYARRNKLEWREDISNREKKYLRNKIRHELVPMLKTLNPSWERGFVRSMDKISSGLRFWDAALARYRSELLHLDKRTGAWALPVLEIYSRGIDSYLLYELLKPYGFNQEQISDLLENTGKEKVRKFYSREWMLWPEGAFIYMKEREVEDEGAEAEEKSMEEWMLNPPPGINIRLLESGEEIKHGDPRDCYLDAELVPDKVIFRKFRHGDRMHPFGLDGRKKVSDIFQEKGLSWLERERRILLVAEGEVIWVPGIRRSGRYLLGEGTQKIWHLRYVEE